MLRILTILMMTWMMLASCCRKPASVPSPQRSIYYWRTVLSLDSAERRFLKDHEVKKMYVRYFDVVANEQGYLKPNATLRFSDTIPAGIEVIPTVFIVEHCLGHDLTGLAGKIVDRVLKMTETNGMGPVRELQIDCDWTRQSMGQYYTFLEEARKLLKSHGMRLSATIRLHQLSMPAPPVDYGVLMVYNTGDATRHDCANPILDEKDAMPYLKDVEKYDLPLCAAYPNFSWNLLFSGTRFERILYEADLRDSLVFKQVSPDKYVVIQSRDLPSSITDDTHIHAGDCVLVRRVPIERILHIHRLLSDRRKGINDQVIIYDLSKHNIHQYQPHDYEKIYHP